MWLFSFCSDAALVKSLHVHWARMTSDCVTRHHLYCSVYLVSLNYDVDGQPPLVGFEPTEENLGRSSDVTRLGVTICLVNLFPNQTRRALNLMDFD